jgi:zinc protease
MRIALCLITLFLGACQSGGFPTTLDSVRQSEPGARTLTPTTWTTEAGSEVLFLRTEALPMLDVRLTFAAGSSRDGDQPGLASMTSALLGEGAEGLSVDEIARGFENLGAQFSSASYRDMGVVELRTLSDANWRQPALALFTRVVGEPSFPETALARLREQRMQGLRMEKQVPGPQVGKAFNRVIFGDHPYAHPSDGTLESLPQLSRQALVDFWQRYYSAGNAVIALVGDISEDQARGIAEQISDSLPAGEAAPALPDADTLTERQREHITFDSEQTHIMLGNQLIKRGHPDYVPLYVGNHALGGGGFASILTEEVRQQRGYVYGIRSSVSPMAAGGPFTVSLQTANRNADAALTLTLELIRDFVETGPTPAQLQASKDNIIGSFPLSTASNSDMVGQLAAIGFYDLPLDYLGWFQQQVEQVDAERIRQAFDKHLDPDDLAIVSIGPAEPATESNESEE